MYETNAIQLHFLLWSGWICSIFCTRLYSKDIHCDPSCQLGLNQIKVLILFFQIKASNDTSNFDSYPREEEVPPDEFSGWDKEF